MSTTEKAPLEGIAIIGMAGRFPGAKNIEQFWRNLRNGVESITQFSDDDLKKAGVPDDLLENPNYVKSSVVLEDIDLFDAGFFGYTPREAEIMDPQQRFFLECAWEALEHSGYDADRFDGPIGVFGGVSMNSYLLNNLVTSGMLDKAGLQAVLGNNADFLATRVSYKLNLKGPSVDVQTSCSTSLVAVHLACQSLLNGECDMALAGGVSISVPQNTGYLYQEQGIYSPDGHCRAFDADAQGTAGGRGAAIVVLKRVEDAIAAGDTIYAVIRGSAINNDGADKIGFTAPGVEGQANVIAEALAVAGVDPETVGYVETHGTGTPLGDPIEIEALTEAFRASTGRKQYCAVGALKTNVGHLDAAAGTAGLIKTALALYHREIPPSLNYKQPNPKIDFENSPFFVNTKLAKWESNGSPRRAGISSFGMGGTNAHVVLEEAGERVQESGGAREQGSKGAGEQVGASRRTHLLLLSAKTETALDAATGNLTEHLKQHSEQDLADVACTLQTGRKQFGHRRMLVCETCDDAIKALADPDSGKVQTGFCEDSAPEVAFMFTGQGAQYVNMGKDLYEDEPLFREQVDRCCRILQPHLGLDLRTLLYPELFSAITCTRSYTVSDSVSQPIGKHGQESRSFGMDQSPEERLKQTAFTQPALFVIEYALAQLWQSWGIAPQAMIGHSIGEYVAACLAGVFSLEDALTLVAKRGQLMRDLPAGAMLAVPLPKSEVELLLDGPIDIAAINDPEGSGCVVSGTFAAIKAFENKLSEKGIAGRRLQTSHAFHSAMMDGILEEFTATVGKIELRKPEIPYLSNVTGRWITDDEATNPSYYARHLRQTVLFADGVKALLAEPNRVLLEVGPGRTLATLAKRQINRDSAQTVLHSLPHPQKKENEVAFILQSLGQLWLAGCEIDWTGFYKDEKRRRLPLPTYPFERRRYWVDPGEMLSQRNGHGKTLQKKPDIADWFYVPSWKRSTVGSWELGIRNSELANSSIPHSALPTPNLGRWLIFADACGLGERLADRLEKNGREVIVVKPGKKFARTGERAYTIKPQHREDYDLLVAECRAQMIVPDNIIHAWSVGVDSKTASTMDLGFFSLVYMAQAFASWKAKHALQMTVLTSEIHEVFGNEELQPEKALIGGPCKVIPQEYPKFSCRSIDVVIPESGRWQESLIDALLSELVPTASDPVVAYRGAYRWTQVFEPVRYEEKQGDLGKLRERGVYWVTGGTGGIGLEVAEYLAKTVQARLVLTGRAALPEKARWQKWLADHSADDMSSRKIRKLQALESLGAEVLYRQADAADEKQMRAVVEETEKRFGEIHGVIHAAGADKTAIIIQQITRAACEAQFRPKLQGLKVLERVLQDRELDFCIVQSSLSSVLGALGFVAYTAAHLYMDAFVQKHNRASRTKWLSVNWDNWLNWKEPETVLAGEEASFCMSAEEGAEAFGRALSNGYAGQLVVSTGDLPTRMMRWLQRDRKVEQAESKANPDLFGTRYARPQLKNDYAAPENDTEQKLADIWAEALGIEKVGRRDNFFELGGDSVLIIQIISKAGQAGLRITANQVFSHPTVAELAQMATQHEKSAEQGVVTGAVPLTPIQRWFFERDFPEPNHFNLPMLLEVQKPLDAGVLQKAFVHLIRHHDALRLRFRHKKSSVEQFHSQLEEAVPFEHVDLSKLPEAQQKKRMREKMADLQASLNLSDGPVVCVAYFTFGEKAPGKMLLVAHHLVVDVVSWRILLEDLQTAIEQLTGGQKVSLPAKTTSFKKWAEKLRDYAHSDEIASAGEYWLSLPWGRVTPIPVDRRDGGNLQGVAQTVSAALDTEATRSLLRDVPQAYNTQINEVLLTALLQTFAGWTEAPSLLLNLEAHGREEILENVDLSRTVGWFTSLFPVLLTLDAPANIGAALKSVKEQMRRIPQKGIGYGILRYLRERPPDAEIPNSKFQIPNFKIEKSLPVEEKEHPPGPPQGGNLSGENATVVQKLEELPQPEVSFLYMGQFGSGSDSGALFRISEQGSGPACSPSAPRQHLLDIFSLVRDERLRVEWMFSKDLYQSRTIEYLANDFITKLQAIIRHCRSTRTRAYTPSDFPGAKLSQGDLDKFLKKLGRTAQK